MICGCLLYCFYTTLKSIYLEWSMHCHNWVRVGIDWCNKVVYPLLSSAKTVGNNSVSPVQTSARVRAHPCVYVTTLHLMSTYVG